MRTPEHIKSRASLILTLILFSIINPFVNAQISNPNTIWSGEVNLPDGYTINSGESVTVISGTTIRLGDGERIWVEGRLSIEGDFQSNVNLEILGNGNHEGINFNSTSLGFGSKIENLTITDSTYGITIYGSDPIIINTTIINSDRVGIDIFDYGNPRIYDLKIYNGGQDIHGTTTNWRYGIGISVGYHSSIFLNNATISNLTTRGINLWGQADGVLRNLELTNISGSTLAACTAIWVEDSVPLFENTTIFRSDNGIISRSETESWPNRPTFVRTTIEDSLYRGVLVDKSNKSAYLQLGNSQSIFEDLIIRGTGGQLTKTPGLGINAFEVNTSSVIFTGTNVIEQNPVVGFRGYMIDNSTNISGLILKENGHPSTVLPDWKKSSLMIRVASWTKSGPAVINNLTIINSSGIGAHLTKGGIIGNNWSISNSGSTGLMFNEFHPRLSSVSVSNSLRRGISVLNSGNVELSDIHSSNNSAEGFLFRNSNYIEVDGKNVTCNNCTSTSDFSGMKIINSVDLQLKNTEIKYPANGLGLKISNGNLIHPGHVVIDKLAIISNSSSHAIEFHNTSAKVNLLDISGENSGLYWSGSELDSYLNNSMFSSENTNCLYLENHQSLFSDNISFSCQFSPSVNRSIVSFSNSKFLNHTHSFKLLGSSNVSWISSSPIGNPTNIGNNILDVRFFLKVFVVNQYSMNIPNSEISINFSEFENPKVISLPFSGFDELGPFIGKRWNSTNWSETNIVNITCNYDNTSNSTELVSIDEDKNVYCRIDLDNQKPYIIWDYPEDNLVTSSGSILSFSANNSFDLDRENLFYSWQSNLDGNLSSECNGNENGSYLIVNLEDICLSDGSHLITLLLCDSSNNCVNETRSLVLQNSPPILVAEVLSHESSDSGMVLLGLTSTLLISLFGTSDKEDNLWCWYESELEKIVIDPINPVCPEEFEINFTNPSTENFLLTIYAYDGFNNPVEKIFEISLYNELPIPNLSIYRDGTNSSDMIYFDSSNSFDPEGDEIIFELYSSIDGILNSGQGSYSAEYWGYLTKGMHEITLLVSDNSTENIGKWNSFTTNIFVSNSEPKVTISEKITEYMIDSSDIISFELIDSGDWDLSCSDFPNNGLGFYCNPHTNYSSDIVSVLWESDLIPYPIGDSWKLETRLPSGTHNISITINDGHGKIISDFIIITISESAPIIRLVNLTSSIPIKSSNPILFDLTESFDADGDLFTLKLLSNIVPEPIINNSQCCNSLIPVYLAAGNHKLIFILSDTKGNDRYHYQNVTVLPSNPVSVIFGKSDGEYIPAGQIIELTSQSFDSDGDIILSQWIVDNELISDKESVSLSLKPGERTVDLLVTDSRGATSSDTINLTIGFSEPQLNNLSISIKEIEIGKPVDTVITVHLTDLDGTCDMIVGQLISGGISEEFLLNDDGIKGDVRAGDNIFSYRSFFTVDEGKIAKLEVFAVDNSINYTKSVLTVPVIDEEQNNLQNFFQNDAISLIIILIILLAIIGMFFQIRRTIEINKDMEVIESWSTFSSDDETSVILPIPSDPEGPKE